MKNPPDGAGPPEDPLAPVLEGALVIDDEPDGADEPPPILGSWTRLYALVLLNLVVLIAAFTAFTRYFR